jgi:hypothetical protein
MVKGLESYIRQWQEEIDKAYKKGDLHTIRCIAQIHLNNTSDVKYFNWHGVDLYLKKK